jgi:competence protein ComEA
MKPLAWKMVPPRIAERTSAVPILLLLLLSLHFLKPSPSTPLSPDLPCRAPIFVQVEGEVRYPGVYAFCREPLTEDVLCRGIVMNRSGTLNGPLEFAPLASGTKITVVHEGQDCRVHRGEMDAHHKVTLGIPLSINRETEKGLTAVPGIGVKLAGAIVRDRERRGGFKTIDEIAGVPGIGRALYGKIKPYLAL